MVECNAFLDDVFLSLADGTRRDMLRLLKKCQAMSIGEIAEHYKLTFAGVSKHLMVLQKAKLITKQRKGKQQIVTLNPAAFNEADKYIQQYQKLWNERFDRLETLLKEGE